MDGLIGDFLAYCIVQRGLRPRSIATYGWILRGFAEDCRRRRGPVGPAALTPADVAAWLTSQADLDANSRSLRLGVLANWWGWARRAGKADVDLLAGIGRPKRRRRLPPVPSRAAVARLLEATRRAADALAGRDLAILTVLYASGVRLSEAAHLRIGDLDLARRAVLVREGKGGKDRLVILPRSSTAVLARYLGPRLETPEAAVFLSDTGTPLQADAIYRVVRRRAQRAGLPGRLTAHALRHALASHLVDAGAPLSHVRDLLGHASLESTNVYTHTSGVLLRETVDRYHPLTDALGATLAA